MFQAIVAASLFPRIALTTESPTALSTSGRFIVNSSGQRVKLRCVNCMILPLPLESEIGARGEIVEDAHLANDSIVKGLALIW